VAGVSKYRAVTDESRSAMMEAELFRAHDSSGLFPSRSSLRSEMIEQERLRGFERARSMTDALFDLVRQLAEAFFIAVRHKDGIVAEPATTARLKTDAAFACSRKECYEICRAVGNGDDADEARSSLCI
jgi:hypothetical protein